MPSPARPKVHGARLGCTGGATRLEARGASTWGVGHSPRNAGACLVFARPWDAHSHSRIRASAARPAPRSTATSSPSRQHRAWTRMLSPGRKPRSRCARPGCPAGAYVMSSLGRVTWAWPLAPHAGACSVFARGGARADPHTATPLPCGAAAATSARRPPPHRRISQTPPAPGHLIACRPPGARYTPHALGLHLRAYVIEALTRPRGVALARWLWRVEIVLPATWDGRPLIRTSSPRPRNPCRGPRRSARFPPATSCRSDRPTISPV